MVVSLQQITPLDTATLEEIGFTWHTDSDGTNYIEDALVQVSDNVHFDDEGIYDAQENPYEYWFKLYPWEDIAVEEGELATTLTKIVQNQKAN
jgi:glutathionylspermidine synthase